MVEATPDMCYYCFDILKNHFRIHKNDLLNGIKNSKKRKHATSLYNLPNYSCALFVGWKIDMNGDMNLRGCKGTHSVLPLEEGLRTYSLLSAFDDTRFEMMREEEVPALTCSVSLLYDFEKVKDCKNWEIGIHGIKIEFEDSKNKYRSATFLPQVAPQFGYTRRQTLKRLVKKSGTKDKFTKALAAKIRTTRFKGSLCYASYDEWQNILKTRRPV